MTQLASDTFTRANNPTLSAPWVDARAGALIVSNQVGCDPLNGDGYSYYNGVSFPNDGYAQVKISQPPALQKGAAAGYRMQGSDRSGYYAGYTGPDTSSTDRRIFLYNVGTFVAIATEGIIPTTGEMAKIEATGTTWKYYADGVFRFSNTDATYASGKAGLFAGASDTADPVLDDWSAGDLLTGGGGGLTLLGAG